MLVETECSKCGKSFEAGEEIYTADIGTELTPEKVIICSKCAKTITQDKIIEFANLLDNKI